MNSAVLVITGITDSNLEVINAILNRFGLPPALPGEQTYTKLIEWRDEDSDDVADMLGLLNQLKGVKAVLRPFRPKEDGDIAGPYRVKDKQKKKPAP